ncbi:WD40 repeat-like protein [Basidiobolus meristosporus CBS 931.73]|uniref:WD40 repeat-like protein n=1 Tax=Basidiobolus meristosporus CBS 931.73 TaxID=1314790 RepID=A0A1Y1XYW2_9FUNG|nr:WD40 repeat-like protein [Basidiobolus meristosporus CBS 931.73]|eukprot:ORX90940.1 WD40 repeat-like protein [Basidiobolus meristosporus CBS 931.73]
MVVQSEKVTYIEVQLHEAKGLTAMDKETNSSDPYVVMTVGTGKGSQRAQSKTVHENLNPLYVAEGDSKIKFTLFDRDFLSNDDPLGEVEYDFSELSLNSLVEKTLPIAESQGSQPWAGAIYPPSQFIPSANNTPNESLQIDRVYGYRTRDCRNNIFTLPNATGESPRIVYFAGSLGIVHDLKSDTQRFFTGHNDDVISIAVHPSGEYVATGDVASVNDPEGGVKVHIWKSKKPEDSPVATLKCGQGTVFKGVVSVTFSPNGKYLVAVCKDKDHTIEMFDWKASSEPVISTSGHSDLVLDIVFNPLDESEFVAFGVKHVKFWRFDGSPQSLNSKKGVFGPLGKIQTILSATYIDKGTIATGCMDGSIYMWDIAKRQVSGVIENAHQGPIFAMHFDKSAGHFYSGGKDGKIMEHQPSSKSAPRMVWNGVGKSIRALEKCDENTLVVGTEDSVIYHLDLKDPAKPKVLVMAHDSFKMSEVWGLATHPDAPEFVTCGDDQVVAHWDMHQKKLIHKVNLGIPLRSVAIHPREQQIAVTAVTDKLIILELQGLTKIHEIEPKKAQTIDSWQHVVKYSPNGEYLAIGAFSADTGIDIYATKGWKHIGTCHGHSSRVTRMDWSNDSQHLQSNSIDSELLFWQIPSCEQQKHPSKLSDVDWNTYECPIGWPTLGTQESWMTGREIYAVSRSPRGNVLVSGNTRSQVKLYSYPAYRENAPAKSYKGHSSFVTNVAFSCDGEYVLSTGGMDGCVIQWKVIE